LVHHSNNYGANYTEMQWNQRITDSCVSSFIWICATG